MMCPKCSGLYQLKDCTTAVPEGSAKCSFVECPNDPQRKRSKCNALLMKQVEYGSTRKFVPRKTFWCNSISEGLKSILKRPGMLQMCNKWKESESKNGHLSDIYMMVSYGKSLTLYITDLFSMCLITLFLHLTLTGSILTSIPSIVLVRSTLPFLTFPEQKGTKFRTRSLQD